MLQFPGMMFRLFSPQDWEPHGAVSSLSFRGYVEMAMDGSRISIFK